MFEQMMNSIHDIHLISIQLFLNTSIKKEILIHFFSIIFNSY